MEAQTTNQIAGWSGAILGTVMGVIGGIIGSYFSIKNTKGPRERAFVVKACLVCWFLIFAFVIGMWLAPGIYKAMLGAAYVVALIVGIFWWNKRQAQIRAEESQNGR